MTNKKYLKEKPFFFAIPSVDWVYKYRMPLDWCDKLVLFSEEYATEETLKNVRSQKSTGWYLNKEKGFEYFLESLAKLIEDFYKYQFAKRSNIPAQFVSTKESVKTKFFLNSFWVSWFDEDGYTWPHNHYSEYYGSMGAYSFSIYLGESETSISFQSPNDLEFNTVKVSKGDILFFPSDLMHMTFDVSLGRVIASGNFHAFIEPLQDDKAVS